MLKEDLEIEEEEVVEELRLTLDELKALLKRKNRFKKSCLCKRKKNRQGK